MTKYFSVYFVSSPKAAYDIIYLTRYFIYELNIVDETWRSIFTRDINHGIYNF